MLQLPEDSRNTYLQLHAQDTRKLINLQTLRRSLRRVTAFLAVICRLGVVLEVLDCSKALQAADQVRGTGSSGSAQLTLLVLKLNVKTQIRHRVVGVGGFAALVAHYAASEFAVESAMEEALALGVVALGVTGSRRVKSIDQELEVFVGILLAVACHFL